MLAAGTDFLCWSSCWFVEAGYRGRQPPPPPRRKKQMAAWRSRVSNIFLFLPLQILQLKRSTFDVLGVNPVSSWPRCFKLGCCESPSTVRADQNKGKDGSVDEDEVFIRKFRWEEIEVVTKDFSRVIGRGGYSNVYLANLSGSQGAVKIHAEAIDSIKCSDKNTTSCSVSDMTTSSSFSVTAMIPMKVPWCSSTLPMGTYRRNYTKANLQIVHGDIKPSNVLLDEYFNCKLCDFGSAKMGFSSTVKPPSCLKQVMVGSPGYTDPHYLRTGLASKKNDVYSLGVVMLELVTGMKAFCPVRGHLLTSIMAPCLRGIDEHGAEEKVAALVDPRLCGEFDLEEARALLLIAALCLHH
ncbi:Beta-1,3-n-acetylglucosaminyltransferase radical fringe isoform 1 [Hibiscus syriacus]|uniref:Beta-1,3-n-acetylglucosaminyltransferase radical fringe isoform 1 n=1 Tax=Hibiscus syriacus TaxID=106335 RepID=A0A6A3BYB2_HIBSY|nr:Beta-1,3-n-acetylglucosaminyltransferase radical fringe isoform 1 [Hibiscus syriacus]